MSDLYFRNLGDCWAISYSRAIHPFRIIFPIAFILFPIHSLALELYVPWGRNFFLFAKTETAGIHTGEALLY